MRLLSTVLVAALALAGGVAPAAAQSDYPTRQIDFIVPFPPGGPLDAAMRILQPSLQATLGHPIVLVNKGGGGGALGMDVVAKSKPDGYTVAASVKSTLTILAATRPDLPYKVNEFIPVANAVSDLGVITTKAGGRWKSLEELVADARKNPGKLSYGSAGVGTVSFFMMELFKLSYGVDIAHVPFSGSAPVKNAVLGGHVDLGSSGISTMAPLIKSGDLIPLVTTSPTRLARYPDLPTIGETVPGFQMVAWFGLFAPAATPPQAIGRLRTEVARFLAIPDTREKFNQTGPEPWTTRPDEFAAVIRSDYERNGKLVKSVGIRID